MDISLILEVGRYAKLMTNTKNILTKTKNRHVLNIGVQII